MEIQQVQLTKPYKGATILHVSQGFHSNHQAIDIVSKYGTPLVAPENCKVIGLWGDGPLSTTNEGLERGYGLKLKGVESGLTHIYWHTNPVFPVSTYENVTRGQIIAFMGNAGNVNIGGKYVPLDERNIPPYKGTHLHLEIRDADGNMVDPAQCIDWSTEPKYSTGEWIAAWMRVLGKMGKIIST